MYFYFDVYVIVSVVTQIGQELAALTQYSVISHFGQLTCKKNTLSAAYQSLIDRIAVVSHSEQ